MDLKLQVSIEKDLLDVLVGSLSENKEEYKSNLETLEGLKEVFVHEFELIKENASSYSTHIRLRLQDEMVLYFNGKKASDEVLEFLEYL